MRLTKAKANDKKIILENGNYNVIVENDAEKNKTHLGIADWQLMFSSKEAVIAHIAMIHKALEFWECDEEKSK